MTQAENYFLLYDTGNKRQALRLIESESVSEIHSDRTSAVTYIFADDSAVCYDCEADVFVYLSPDAVRVKHGVTPLARRSLAELDTVLDEIADRNPVAYAELVGLIESLVSKAKS